MEPHQLLGMMESRSEPGLFLLGMYDTSVTIVAQQTRALNLAWALAAEGRLLRRTRVAVLGAGPAGVTFAGAACLFGADVTVLEKGPLPFHVIRPSPKKETAPRFLHPHVGTWPRAGWEEKNAGLPLGNWCAGTPDHVAQCILKGIPKASKLSRAELWCSCTEVTRLHSTDRWAIDWIGTRTEWAAFANSSTQQACCPGGATIRLPRPAAMRADFDLLVLAVGYGPEKALPGKGYWQPGSKPVGCDDCSPCNDEASGHLLVSGIGDGGVADGLCHLGLELDGGFIGELYCLERCVRREDPKRWQRFRESILLRRRYGRRHGWGHARNMKAYRGIASDCECVVKKFRTLVQKRLRSGRRVKFNAMTREGVLASHKGGDMSAGRTLLHSFLVWLLVDEGIVTFQQGALEWSRQEDRQVATVGGRNYRNFVVRHGRAALSSSLDPASVESKVESARKALAGRNQLDVSGAALWPRGFFGSLR